MAAGWLSICASFACDGNSTAGLPSSPSEVPHAPLAAAQHNHKPIGNVHSVTRLAPMARTIRRWARSVLALALTRADGRPDFQRRQLRAWIRSGLLRRWSLNEHSNLSI